MNELSPEDRQTLERAMQLAIQRHQGGDLASAEALYSKVLGAHARHPVALHNLGLIVLERGNIPAALQLLSSAVQENPGEAVFHFNHGLALQRAENYADAVTAYRNATRLKSDYRAAWENLGTSLQELERLEDAIDAYEHALRIDRCSPIARLNLGNVLRAMGRAQEAEQQYLEALDCNPLNATVALQYGVSLLSRGAMADGWRWYDWRTWDPEFLLANPLNHVPLPKWDGTSLASQRLLLYGEQGIGDEIMFASCVPDASSAAASIVLLCQPRLAALFARSFPAVTVLPKPRAGMSPLPAEGAACDLQLSLASLPRFFRHDVARFSGKPYLRADADAVARWRHRLGEVDARLKVGLSWRGGLERRAREARSVPLEQLSPLFDHEDICFVNVQYGSHQEEIARFNVDARRPLLSYGEIDPLHDLDGFAALLEALDLVITVDNSTAHLAGALGVPTWLLLPSQTDWRWMQQDSRTPWYETVRIIRQADLPKRAWAGVMERIASELAQVEPRSAPPPALPTQPRRVCALSLSAAAAPRALLLNDTSYWYHWGCTCTSIALHQGLRTAGYAVDAVPITDINTLEPLPRSLDAFDDERVFKDFWAKNRELMTRMGAASSIVINGEGSLHDLGHTALALLYCAYVAKQRLGKHTQIINHSCYPASGNQPSPLADRLYRKVYATLDYVAVREEHSAAELQRLGIAATQAFDCLPLFIHQHPLVAKPASGCRVVLAGSVCLADGFLDLLVSIAENLLAKGCAVEVLVGANAHLAQDDVQFVAALHARLRGRYRLVAATSEAEWLGTIAGADLLVSGRFHHSIAAACLGTPFLVASSNTAKIDGLLRRLELPKDLLWISPAEPESSLHRAGALLANPGSGRPSPGALANLRELAARNFHGLPSAQA